MSCVGLVTAAVYNRALSVSDPSLPVLAASLCSSATLAAICSPLALSHGPGPIRSLALTGLPFSTPLK